MNVKHAFLASRALRPAALGFGLAAVVAATAMLPACGSTGRVRDEGEAQLVGDRRAGTLTYDEIVKQATTDLVAQAGMQARAQGPWRIAFFGIETQGAEELRDQLPSIHAQIEEILVNSGPFTVLSRKAVDRARQEVGLRDFDDMFIAKNRDALLGVLGRDSAAPDLFVYGTTTTQTTESEGGIFTRDTKERRYELTLQMIDASTGEVRAMVRGRQEIEYLK